MDSLLASYQSDEEGDEDITPQVPPQIIINHSYEPFQVGREDCRSNPSLASIPPPKADTSSLLAALPPPKLTSVKETITQTEKRRVSFQPPILSPLHTDVDDYEDTRQPKLKKTKSGHDAAISEEKSGLAAFLPAPKFGSALGDGVGTSSKKISLEETPISQDPKPPLQPIRSHQPPIMASQTWQADPSSAYISNPVHHWDHHNQQQVEEYSVEEGYGNFGGAVDNRDPIAEALANERRRGSRGPAAYVLKEVKQQELTKGAKREDNLKASAFGPTYQPISAGDKNKPSKMHRRKHQIGSLYFDMRQKEMELTDRRAKGQLTKAETHAKYGW